MSVPFSLNELPAKEEVTQMASEAGGIARYSFHTTNVSVTHTLVARGATARAATVANRLAPILENEREAILPTRCSR